MRTVLNMSGTRASYGISIMLPRGKSSCSMAAWFPLALSRDR